MLGTNRFLCVQQLELKVNFNLKAEIIAHTEHEPVLNLKTH